MYKEHLNEIITKAATYRALQENISSDDSMVEVYAGIYRAILFPNGRDSEFKFSLESFRSNRLLVNKGFNFSVKNLKTLLYGYHQILKKYKTINTNEAKSFDILLNNQLKDFVKYKDRIDETNAELNSNYTKVHKYSKFLERGFEEKYDILDLKLERRISGYYQSEYKHKCIESKYKAINKITPLSCHLGSETSLGEGIESLKKSSEDTSKIWREDKRFKFIIARKENEDSVNIKSHSVKLELIFLFDRVTDFNQIDIDFGSSIPTIIRKDSIQYWGEEDAGNESWLEATTFFEKDNLIKKSLFLNKFSTNKIKIILEQKRCYNQVKLSDISWEDVITGNTEEVALYKIYDLSIDSINFYNKNYRQKAFYREKESVIVNSPLNIGLVWEGLNEVQSNCFIEPSLEIEIYNEDNISRAAKGCRRIFVPIYQNNVIKETLHFKNKKAKISFIPESSINESDVTDFILSIKKNGAPLPRDRYEILVDGEECNTEVPGGILECFSCEIKLENEVKVEMTDVFVVEYKTKKTVGTEDKDITIDDGSIVFGNKYQGSTIGIRPRFLFRNKSTLNESCIIKSYSLLIENISDTKNRNVNYNIVGRD